MQEKRIHQKDEGTRLGAKRVEKNTRKEASLLLHANRETESAVRAKP